MDPAVSLSNQVVREVRESLGLTLDQAAMHTGYSRSHINAIELGDRVAPMEYAAGLHRLAINSQDPRIAQVIDPRLHLVGGQHLATFYVHCVSASPHPAAAPPEPTPPPGDPRELIPAEIAAVRKHADLLAYVERICRDGRVDAADDVAITQYQQSANQLIEMVSRTFTAVAHLRIAQKGAGR